MSKARVLIIDDSALMRELLSHILGQDDEIEVVGVAADPLIALKKIQTLAPTVLTLDVEMPRMDGLTFLEQLMKQHPMPVVMVSSLTERGAETTLKALELGAVDFVTKPSHDATQTIQSLAEQLVKKVKVAARAAVRRPTSDAPKVAPLRCAEVIGRATASSRVIAIGASTGGTEAIAQVLSELPADSPGIVIVQHMPPRFTTSFAQRLDRISRLQVREAQNGDRVLPGQALVAPGDFHMEIVRNGAQHAVRVFTAPPVNMFRPSVDVLFHSCAKHLGSQCVAAILTGMGSDGARGMLALHQAGTHTVAQDEASCVVFGMPREAIALGGVDRILPLNEISTALLRAAARPNAPAMSPSR